MLIPKKKAAEAPLSHRKHFSWNAPSVAPPLIQLHHTMSILSDICIIHAYIQG